MLRKSATIPKKDTRPYRPLTSAHGAEFNHLRQQFNIDRWCREKGIDRHSLETHPCVSDIRTLLDFDDYCGWMTAKDREIWTHAWKWVYKKQLPINAYIEKRLSSIVEGCNQRRHARESYLKRVKNRRADNKNKLEEYSKREQKRQHIQQRLENKAAGLKTSHASA